MVKSGTFLDDPVTFNHDSRSKVTVSLPRAQDRTLQLIIVVCGPESVLPDVLAIHTIEMIPKSMILTIHRLRRTIRQYFAVSYWCADRTIIIR